MSDAMIEGLTQVILSLKPAERKRLIDRLLETKALHEDDEDQLLIEIRSAEPSSDYQEIRKGLKKKGHIKKSF